MTVRLERDGHTARVTIDRPERMNAIDPASEARLEEIWQEIEARDEIWAVVLTGAGERAFCAGADLKAAKAQSDAADASGGDEGLAYWHRSRPDGFGGIAARVGFSKPVIARINGHALGGGFEMLLGCDICIAAEHASFGLPEPRVGFMPLEGGMAALARQIPLHRAMGMLLTGRRFSAAEALGWGFLNEVVPAAELDGAVERWLADVLACAPACLRAIKAVARRTGHLRLDDALAQRLPELSAALACEDREEGLRAFAEKRPPVWSGR